MSESVKVKNLLIVGGKTVVTSNQLNYIFPFSCIIKVYLHEAVEGA